MVGKNLSGHWENICLCLRVLIIQEMKGQELVLKKISDNLLSPTSKNIFLKC